MISAILLASTWPLVQSNAAIYQQIGGDTNKNGKR